ncbi:MAG: hypothetical protein EOP93_22205 [Lysobacteraceae bacterium]|nr:MAG: hypothetical protein EOP93_22205 [Xanthomonadaceae bacterium]
MTQPDGGKWKFGLSALVVGAAHPMGTSCDGVATPGSGSYTGTIVAPSGALVAYTLAPVLFGRSWVTRQCMATPGGMDEFAVEPYLFASLAIASKKISGPGLPAAGLSWTYAYGAPNQCWAYSAGAGTGGVPCTANSPVTRSTVVTDPDGGRVRYTFGNRYEIDEGLLLKEEHGWNGTSALRTVAFEYADPEAPPYAALNGASIRNQGDYDITSLKRPQRKVTTIQQGRFFIWEVATGCGGLPYCFDADARPTQVVKSSGAVQ